MGARIDHGGAAMTRGARRVVFIAGGGTGGHLMPALAIATRLRERRPDIEPVLIGSERGIESQLLPTRDFRYHLLPVEPIYRRQWWKNVRWPFVAIRLLSRLSDAVQRRAAGRGRRHRRLCVRTRRSGSPLVEACRPRCRSRTPIPASSPACSRAECRQVYLGLPEARSSAQVRPEHRGLRHRQSDHSARSVPPCRCTPSIRHRRSLCQSLLVTGGSQGAHAINDHRCRLARGWWRRRPHRALGHRPRILRRVQVPSPATGGPGLRLPRPDRRRLRGRQSGRRPCRHDDRCGAVCLGPPLDPHPAARLPPRITSASTPWHSARPGRASRSCSAISIPIPSASWSIRCSVTHGSSTGWHRRHTPAESPDAVEEIVAHLETLF